MINPYPGNGKDSLIKFKLILLHGPCCFSLILSVHSIRDTLRFSVWVWKELSYYYLFLCLLQGWVSLFYNLRVLQRPLSSIFSLLFLDIWGLLVNGFSNELRLLASRMSHSVESLCDNQLMISIPCQKLSCQWTTISWGFFQPPFIDLQFWRIFTIFQIVTGIILANILPQHNMGHQISTLLYMFVYHPLHTIDH